MPHTDVVTGVSVERLTAAKGEVLLGLLRQG
jgi:hypothetical protein